MGPIHGPSEGSFVVLIVLVLCGIAGIMFSGYELVVWILQHIKIV